MAEPDLTADDHLVAHTNNGLRPEDTDLPQPSQDPDVVLDSRGEQVAG